MPLAATQESDMPVPSAPRPLTLLSRKPSFVEKSTGIKAPRLQPKTLEPHRCSTATAPLAFLANIEKIEINETRVRNGVTYYVLDVYLFHYNSRLPAILNNPRRALAQQTPIEGRKPDYQVEHRYSEFSLLREQAFDWSCMNPQFVCDYCNEFIIYIRFELCQPRFLTKFTTSKSQRKKILQSFITSFIRLAQYKGYHNRECNAHEHIPHLVERFVRDPDHGETMSTRSSTTSSVAGL
ncbi:hypothetical protein FI667_g3511, partial [Globisporangium splendens]